MFQTVKVGDVIMLATGSGCESYALSGALVGWVGLGRRKGKESES